MENKSITIRLDTELHKQIKLRAIELDKTVKDYLIELVRADLLAKEGK
ncbi:hypothetical protein [Kurthia sibirica]|nr:hypothetical protein [Kurthia sibirica]GEK35436.1 hypothetical protein KSI01_29690 [Kurthia sibirica]